MTWSMLIGAELHPSFVVDLQQLRNQVALLRRAAAMGRQPGPRLRGDCPRLAELLRRWGWARRSRKAFATPLGPGRPRDGLVECHPGSG